MHLSRTITVVAAASAVTAMPRQQLQRRQPEPQAAPSPPPVAAAQGNRASSSKTDNKHSLAKASPAADTVAVATRPTRNSQMYHPDLVPDPWSWRRHQQPQPANGDAAEPWQPPGPGNPKFVGNFMALLALSLATGIGEGMLGMVLARWWGVPALFVPTYGVVIGVLLGVVSLFVLSGAKVEFTGDGGSDGGGKGEGRATTKAAATGGAAADAAGLGALAAKVERFAAEHGMGFRIVRADSAKHAAELRRVEREVRMSLRPVQATHDAQVA